MPTARELVVSGVREFPADRASEDHEGGEGGSEAGSSRSQPMASKVTCVGTGLPPITQKLRDRIIPRQYVEFTEFPPAKGKSRPVSQPGEGQLVLVQAADLLQSRRTIPDFATWGQCFAIYVTVLSSKYPELLPDLMGYMSVIAKASKRYCWSAWVIYDQQFRQEAAGNPEMQWEKVDPSLYAQCFTGQELSKENWCNNCQELDHKTAECPYRPRKRSWNMGPGQMEPQSRETGSGGKTVCIKFNQYNGDCKYGKECKFAHVCARCGEGHPAAKCK